MRDPQWTGASASEADFAQYSRARDRCGEPGAMRDKRASSAVASLRRPSAQSAWMRAAYRSSVSSPFANFRWCSSRTRSASDARPDWREFVARDKMPPLPPSDHAADAGPLMPRRRLPSRTPTLRSKSAPQRTTGTARLRPNQPGPLGSPELGRNKAERNLRGRFCSLRRCLRASVPQSERCRGASSKTDRKSRSHEPARRPTRRGRGSALARPETTPSPNC